MTFSRFRYSQSYFMCGKIFMPLNFLINNCNFLIFFLKLITFMYNYKVNMLTPSFDKTLLLVFIVFNSVGLYTFTKLCL